MKINLWCDSGANCQSCRRETIDLEEEWGITDEEWNDYTEEQKHEIVQDWANNLLDIGFQEI